MTDSADPGRRLLPAILGGLALWGIALAVGAYLELRGETPADERDPRKFWIVLAVSAAFLLFWIGALAFRKWRTDRRR